MTTATTAEIPNNFLWIGGTRVPASSAQGIPVFDPSTGQECGWAGDGTIDDASRSVDAAHRAYLAWRETPPRERANVLRRCYEQMTMHGEELAHLISSENGKAIADARGEVAYAADFFRWYSEEAVRIVGQVSPSPSGTNDILVQYEPIGVAILITPWNFPAAMATRKIAPALAAGCSVILKPATETPLTAYRIAELCAEAGVPDGVLNVITSRAAGTVVSPMLHDPRVRALSFTGSTEVGRHLLREAADQVLKCSMELGGNAPFLIFEDADLEKALEGLMVAKMRNGGQACTAANRIYAHRRIATDLGRQLSHRMAALHVGAGTRDSTQCGPLINTAAVENVSRLVEDAKAQGATVLTGGTPLDRDGSFYAPTVLMDVTDSCSIVHSEIFGPVASIIVFDDEEEAISAANDTDMGLAAYVYTADLRRAMRVTKRLESGMVAINRGLVSDPAAPFGGVKQSGLGREGGHEGVLEFMESKYIAVDWDA